MAKDGDDRKWGNMRPGRHSAEHFDRLASPLGYDGKETPCYTPARPVNGAARDHQGTGYASQSESARAQRRGEQ